MRYNSKMGAATVAIDILKILYNTNLSYKGVRVNLLGIPRMQGNNFGSAMYRLNKKGLIRKVEEVWAITNDGKRYLKGKGFVFKKFRSPFDKQSPRNLILMFDIPEVKKAERGWLRWQLKEFNYVMIQRSVWVGPSPLPLDFKKYLKEVKIQDCIKIFKLAKGYRINH